MRKKYLAKQYETLCEDVQNYRFEIVRLNKLLKDKEAQIKQLESRIKDIEVKKTDNEETVKKSVSQISEQEFELNENLPIIDEVTVDSITEYGATVIGELVVVSSEYGNKLSKNNDSQHRELLNLILGRTEVAKSEILGIVSSERCDEEKKSLMDDVKVKAFEYFDGVMAQI